VANVDTEMMHRALALARGVRRSTSPNPWVGCILRLADGRIVDGATHPPGGPHAEADAIARAGGTAPGATAWVTLEPCAHHGRTPPCADALVAAGVSRVVVGIEDPDPRVAGTGVARLRAAGVEVAVGVAAAEVTELLTSYLHHRRTGRPWVVLKLASTLDGRTAAPDGSSRWITGPAARADVHRLRADSDAVMVGAGTVRTDDPELTVRNPDGTIDPAVRQPRRVVVGAAPAAARVRPATEVRGPLPEVLDGLGASGVLQLLVEGGPTLAGSLHRAGLVDRYVVYLAPGLFGGDDARPMFTGPGAPTIDALWRGRLRDVVRLGDDVRLDIDPPVPTHCQEARP